MKSSTDLIRQGNQSTAMTLLPYLFQWATEPDSSWDPQDAAVALTAAGFEGATELTP
jgi:hypothetical protein